METSPHDAHHERPDGGNDQRPSARTNWALIGFLVIAAFFLFTEHRAHLLGILPWLLLLACPLMHFFHHGGHGHHAHGTKSGDKTSGEEQ